MAETTGGVAPSGVGAGPIADLSYRDYDGPLSPPQYRWWVIARTLLRLNIKKRSYWLFTVFGGMYYFIMLVVLFFVDQFAQNSPNPDQYIQRFFDMISWKDQFLHGFAFGQLWFMFLALLVGAGAIANDNRANALLVYLSKPCDKRDYLLGKWVGVWLSLLLAMALPTAFFYAYCGLTYADFGFFGDKLLILRLAALLPLGAAFYASLMLGISSLFHNGRHAGATMAAIYILTNFFTKLMEGAWQFAQWDHGAERDVGPMRDLIGRLYYASIDGLEFGMAKGIMNSRGSAPFGMGGPRRNLFELPPIPTLWVVLLIMATISAFAMWIAWRRIRAVEVVR